MKIIIAPAKKMNKDTDTIESKEIPVLLDRTKEILNSLNQLSYEELKKLWSCNDNIATLNYERLQQMQLEQGLTPAILSYEGIQYKYMAPIIFEDKMFDYINNHLRIISGFYGILNPMDGVIPYRLEMQAKLEVRGHQNLYSYWGDTLYHELEDDVILNLSSKEYAKCIEPFLKPTDTYITCVFGELVEGKVVQKGTYAKMARGEMVRFMAERQIVELEEIKKFNLLEFAYSDTYSTKSEWVFLREPNFST